MPTFAEVPAKVDFPAMERETLARWEREGIVERYLRRNDASDRALVVPRRPDHGQQPDGRPPRLGPHLQGPLPALPGHARPASSATRTASTARASGSRSRSRRSWASRTKRDIETYGIAEFVERCKERVWTLRRHPDRAVASASATGWTGTTPTTRCPTRTTTRSGTSSRRATRAAGSTRATTSCPGARAAAPASPSRRSSPRAIRSGPTLSLYRPPSRCVERAERCRLLVWTTTPWTLAANVAAAVHPELTYVKVQQDDRRLLPRQGRRRDAPSAASTRSLGELHGRELVGLTYRGPFDELPAAAGRRAPRHRLGRGQRRRKAPASSTSRPAAARRTSRCRRSTACAVIAPIDEDGRLRATGFGWLDWPATSDDVAQPIVDNLREKGLLYRAEQYTHRYPTCWRCGTELVFRLVDEWFIAMDELRAADDGRHARDPLDPRVRPGARARLAAQHGRLDDLEEALLGPGAADLRVPSVRPLRGHRLARTS